MQSSHILACYLAVLCPFPHISQTCLKNLPAESGSRRTVESPPSSLGTSYIPTPGCIHLDPNHPEPRVSHLTLLPVPHLLLKPAHFPPRHPCTGCLPMLGYPGSSQGQFGSSVASSLGTELAHQPLPGPPCFGFVKGAFRSIVCSTQQPQITLCSAQGQRDLFARCVALGVWEGG